MLRVFINELKRFRLWLAAYFGAFLMLLLILLAGFSMSGIFVANWLTVVLIIGSGIFFAVIYTVELNNEKGRLYLLNGYKTAEVYLGKLVFTFLIIVVTAVIGGIAVTVAGAARLSSDPALFWSYNTDYLVAMLAAKPAAAAAGLLQCVLTSAALYIAILFVAIDALKTRSSFATAGVIFGVIVVSIILIAITDRIAEVSGALNFDLSGGAYTLEYIDGLIYANFLSLPALIIYSAVLVVLAVISAKNLYKRTPR